MQPTIVYCFDAYCPWCYGFSNIIKKLWTDFSASFDFEVLSGGMILPKQPLPLNVTVTYFQETYKKVEELTGVIFGEDYLWHIRNPLESDWYPNSEKPAIALCIFKEYYPEKNIEFAISLQYALFREGRDLCDDEAYRHLLVQYKIPEKAFYEKLHEESFKEKAFDEFATVKHLKVTGFPCVFLQLSPSKYYMLSNGYTNYTTLDQKIKLIMNENNL